MTYGKAEQLANNKVFCFTTELAETLGDGWTVEPLTNGDGEIYDHGAHLHHTSGMQFFVRHDSYRKNFKISPTVPQNATGKSMSLRNWGVIPYEGHPPVAGVNEKRSGKSAANEIKRKVIEPYEKLYPLIVKEVKEEKNRNTQTLDLADALAEITGTDARFNGAHYSDLPNGGDRRRGADRATLYAGSLTFDISSPTSVTIKGSVTADIAKQIAKLMV